MADRFYGVSVASNNGSTESVTESASTNSTVFEFRWTYDGTGADKVQALRALQAIKGRIERGNFPPV
jgi:hypothetical protein